MIDIGLKKPWFVSQSLANRPRTRSPFTAVETAYIPPFTCFHKPLIIWEVGLALRSTLVVITALELEGRHGNSFHILINYGAGERI